MAAVVELNLSNPGSFPSSRAATPHLEDFVMRPIHVFATALLMLGAQVIQAQDAPAGQAAAERPARGMTMTRVESSFGAPSNRVPAVGQPPITRWEYPGFVVYFEHNHVVHTVAVRQ